MLGMETVYAVRRRVLVEGVSIRQVARQYGLSRNTVRRYLAGAPAGVRKPAARPRPVLDAVRTRMDALLADAPRWTQGKQRLTATQLHRLLVAEGHAVGATVVKAYVAEQRRRQREVFVPLVYSAGFGPS
jgi:transposase